MYYTQIINAYVIQSCSEDESTKNILECTWTGLEFFKC